MSTLHEVAQALRRAPAAPETFAQHQQCAAVRYWAYILAKHKGNVTHAAREAGVHRTHAYKLIHAHGIDPSVFRSEERAS